VFRQVIAGLSGVVPGPNGDESDDLSVLKIFNRNPSTAGAPPGLASFTTAYPGMESLSNSNGEHATQWWRLGTSLAATSMRL
jgi:hypothetical protein